MLSYLVKEKEDLSLITIFALVGRINAMAFRATISDSLVGRINAMAYRGTISDYLKLGKNITPF